MSVLLASDFVPITPLYFYTAELCIFIIPYTARNGISHFIDYYNHRRPHQSLSYVTPYDMLTGKADEIIQQRKGKHLSAQKERRRINRRMAKSQD